MSELLEESKALKLKKNLWGLGCVFFWIGGGSTRAPRFGSRRFAASCGGVRHRPCTIGHCGRLPGHSNPGAVGLGFNIDSRDTGAV